MPTHIKLRRVLYRCSAIFVMADCGAQSIPMVDVKFDSPYQQIEPSTGDKWTLTWGRGNVQFVASGDGSGFGSVVNNVVLGRLSGDDSEQMKGSVINNMEEYRDPTNRSTIEASWRATSLYGVDGALYMFVTCRITPTHPCGLVRSTAERLATRIAFVNSSVIRSGDQGRTWQRTPEDNYRNPMFPGQRFGAPVFISYGQDGSALADNGDRYVYALSNDGYFANGDDYVLGRVQRAKLASLNPNDWTFYQGGDGLRPDRWSSRLADAVPVLRNPDRASTSGVTYIRAFKRYVMASWHYANPGIDLSTKIEFFDAPKPWGPWTKFRDFETGSLGWYYPVVGQKFQMAVDARTVRAILYFSGNPSRKSLLKMNYVPITLSAELLTAGDRNYVGSRE